jgi:hypothetical protein
MAVRIGKTAKCDTDANDSTHNNDAMHIMTENQKTKIDLRMACTYIAGLVCLLKSSLIIWILSRSWAIENMKIHVGLYLYIIVDRIIHEDGVFDTNTVLASVLIMQTINVFRSDPTFHLSQEHMWNQAIVIVYSITCIALTADVDIVQIYMGMSSIRTIILRTSTILTHCILFTCVLFSKPTSNIIAMNWIVIRSTAFVILSIIWSYLCGIPNMIGLLRSSKRIQLTSIGKGAICIYWYVFLYELTN